MPIILENQYEKYEEDEICKGCCTYSKTPHPNDEFEEPTQCTIKARKGNHICPCSSCLIKMICENECYLLDIYEKIK